MQKNLGQEFFLGSGRKMTMDYGIWPRGQDFSRGAALELRYLCNRSSQKTNKNTSGQQILCSKRFVSSKNLLSVHKKQLQQKNWTAERKNSNFAGFQRFLRDRMCSYAAPKYMVSCVLVWSFIWDLHGRSRTNRSKVIPIPKLAAKTRKFPGSGPEKSGLRTGDFRGLFFCH